MKRQRTQDFENYFVILEKLEAESGYPSINPIAAITAKDERQTEYSASKHKILTRGFHSRDLPMHRAYKALPEIGQVVMRLQYGLIYENGKKVLKRDRPALIGMSQDHFAILVRQYSAQWEIIARLEWNKRAELSATKRL